MSDTALIPFVPILEVNQLSPAVQEKAQALAKTINVQDSQAVIQFGVGAQSKIAAFADSILNQIRAKDAGVVGEQLTGLVLKIKEVDVGSLGSGNPLEKIPLIGELFSAVKKFLARYEKLSVQIEQIINELDKARMNLLRDITMLDTLFKNNVEYLAELDVFIAAGQLKVGEIRTVTLPELLTKAELSKDQADTQRYQDMAQLLNRFEKKLYDLKLSRMISLQTGPQIRLIENNNQLLVEKIQSSILNTIPLWKNQIVIAISLLRQQKALEVQKSVTDATNDLLVRNSEMLKQGTLAVTRESERGIVEIETLKKVNADLISTIEETLKIQEDGRQKRAAAEKDLASMEGELKQKLLAAKG
jgi:uncharacterized protein YaaN involved in tellurite resistance